MASDITLEFTASTISNCDTASPSQLSQTITFKEDNEPATVLYVKTIIGDDNVILKNNLDKTVQNNVFNISGHNMGFKPKKNGGTQALPTSGENNAEVTSEQLDSLGITYISTASKFYLMGFVGNNFTTKYALLVQIIPTSVDISALEAEIARVWNENDYIDNYYTENDRYNGKDILSKDKDNPTHGFWYELTKDGGPLKTALGTTYTSQAAVAADCATLKAAIDKLIPKTGEKAQANPTLLYETIHTDWRWESRGYGNIIIESNGQYDGRIKVTAETCTDASWTEYSRNMEEGQALLDELFDSDGKATENNTSDRNGEIEAAAARIDPSVLVNLDYYNNSLDYYRKHLAEAEGLLQQYDPALLNAADYTQESWNAYRDAYGALESDVDYPTPRGIKADIVMLGAFPDHLSELQAARRNLVSNVDIQVSFTYVNNFSAKYPSLRESGQDAVMVTDLDLEAGHTTVAEAVSAAGVTFDSRNISSLLPQGNTSDRNPMYFVFVDGVYMGKNTDAIQLHDGEKVKVVRVCEPFQQVETSAGFDSTEISYAQITEASYYLDSIASISVSAPEDTVKVGDKALFRVNVTGASPTNSGIAFDPSNVTMFVSQRFENAEDYLSHQPTVDTGVKSGADGTLTYTFVEDGWYTVAFFNIEDDVPTFTDVFVDVTVGTYYSLYAGDCCLIHVQAAEDDDALLAQYREEYGVAAAEYFGAFHDYDFAGSYYKDTFKPQHDLLVEHLESATTLKELQEQYNADFALLKEYGATAIDYDGLLSALRQAISYLPIDAEAEPVDLSDLDSGSSELVKDIQRQYGALNEHGKSLLTQKEITLLDALAKVNTDDLPEQAVVTVRIVAAPDLPYGRDENNTGGNPYYGRPDLSWVMTPQLDGTFGTPSWITLTWNDELAAKTGDHVFVRNYLKTTDDLYFMVWSLDNQNWQLSEPVTYGDYDGYFMVDYAIPNDAENGSIITIYTKMWSKAEYDAVGIAENRASAIAALDAAYAAYDLTQYDDDGKAALAQALEAGKAAIEEATSNDAVAAARKAAIAAMAAVSVAEGQQANSSYVSGKTIGRVFVTIENTTYSNLMYGPIAEGWYTLGENDSMMTVVLKVLEDNGYTWSGTGGSGGEKDYSITYLSGITKDGLTLAEFVGGKKSGWMGTLNDWFVNEGFNMFSVANGKLENNDVIHVMYTCSTGTDIGSNWGLNDTTLDSLSFSNGTLSPEFNRYTTDYSLILPEGVSSITVKPVPVNKNYQSRIFLNSYNQDSAMFKRTDAIPVQVGDVIYVGVGEQGWPTMNSGGRPTKYTIRISTADSAIDDLDPSKINLQNYETFAAKLAGIDRSSLSDAGKAKYDTVQARIDYYQAVDELKEAIAALPKIIVDTEDVRDAVTEYAALKGPDLNSLLTIAEINQIETAAELLDILDAIKNTDFTTAGAYDEDALTIALVKWLNGLEIADSVSVSASVDSYKDAVSGKEGSDGSYSATVTVTLKKGNGTAKKTVTGAITRSSDAGIKSITVKAVPPAEVSGTAYKFTLPYGTKLAELTAEAFAIECVDGASITAEPDATDNTKTKWAFTVTAEDGTEKLYTVTFSVSKVKVNVLDSWVYYVSDDVEPVKLDTSAVGGLLEAVNADALGLDEGTEEAFLWLEVRQKTGDNVYGITPIFAADGKESTAVPANALIGEIELTLPVPGTEYARVLYGGKYLDAKGSASGIEFAVAAAGDYTLIPDASLVKVTFHLNGGTSTAVKDGQQIVYFPEDVNKDLPLATKKGDYSFEGWFKSADGSGEAYTKVSADLPTDLYAVWKSLEEDVEVIEYIDKKKVSVDSVLEDDGTAVVTVKSAEPCVVILKDGDSYVPLKAVKDGDSYVFSQKDYKDSMVFIVAAKGDFDKDGDLDLDDFTAANKAIVGQKDVEPLQLLVMGANGKKLKTVDLAKLYLALASGKVEW